MYPSLISRRGQTSLDNQATNPSGPTSPLASSRPNQTAPSSSSSRSHPTMFFPRKLLPWPRPRRSRDQALPRRLFRASNLSDPDDDDPPFTRIPSNPPRAPAPPAPKPKAQATKITPDEPARSDLPFGFRYSYSETDPSWRPIGFREPTRFSPFGPGRLDRPWDGVAASATNLFDAEIKDGDARESTREEVLGEALSEAEVAELVERYRHSDCSRQINLGKFVLLPVPKWRFLLMILVVKLFLYDSYVCSVRFWPN